MGRSLGILEHIRVASPCPASWMDMTGDDRVRHCRLCKLNVYDLSELTREEAERLVFEKEGRLCVRYHARRDGTILTHDCPVGWMRVRRRLRRMFAAVAALLTVSSTLAVMFGEARRRIPLRLLPPFSTIANWIDPPSNYVMGDMVSTSQMQQMRKASNTQPVGSGAQSH